MKILGLIVIVWLVFAVTLGAHSVCLNFSMKSEQQELIAPFTMNHNLNDCNYYFTLNNSVSVSIFMYTTCAIKCSSHSAGLKN